MFTQFAAGARTVVTSALEEARLRGDRRIGTEHLLLGLLHDPDSVAARTLGIDLATAQEALDALDRAALATIGIDAHGVERAPIPTSRKRTPLTSAARAVLPRAVAEVSRTGGRRIGTEHLLLAILDCHQPDPAAELMARLDIDRDAVRERLRQPGT